MFELFGCQIDQPPPALIAAAFTVDMVDVEQLPWWASEALTRDCDGDALRELASLGHRDGPRIREVLPAALAELGVEVPADEVSAATSIYDDMAALLIAGKVEPKQVERVANRLIIRANYPPALLSLPLSEIHFDEAWPADLPRTEANHASLIKDLSLRQLRRNDDQSDHEEI